MKVNVTPIRRPFGEIVDEARRLNRIINSLTESKNSRNAAITQIGRLEAETGFDLRRSA